MSWICFVKTRIRTYTHIVYSTHSVQLQCNVKSSWNMSSSTHTVIFPHSNVLPRTYSLTNQRYFISYTTPPTPQRSTACKYDNHWMTGAIFRKYAHKQVHAETGLIFVSVCNFIYNYTVTRLLRISD